MQQTAYEAAAALERARDLVENTGTSIFLTGKAGTGKTTFLRNVVETTAKTCVVVAPTGVAAINAGGVTIHSFFQISPAPYVPGTSTKGKFNMTKSKLRVIRALDLLIIDEISMVRADLLDAVDDSLRKYRRDPRPFGGVQLLMIGDLHQLSPVVTQSDENILRTHYDSPYFFSSKALAAIDYVTFSLEHVFRQQDAGFINLLNHVRDNRLTAADQAVLNSRLNPRFIPDDRKGYIRLTTHNATADRYNEQRMSMLNTRSGTYTARIKGTFPEASYPTARELTLKVGAQVMFIKNDPSGEREYYNGLIGLVTDITPDYVTVRTTGSDSEIVVSPQIWENVRYTVNEVSGTIETEVQGVFEQMPLRPAWAITIHKSQGLTFDNVIIDAGASFAPGQVYVALSRCRTLEGIVLATPITPAVLFNDSVVNGYMESVSGSESKITGRLTQMKLEYHRRLLAGLFDFRPIANGIESLKRLFYTNFRNNNAEVYRDVERAAEKTQAEIVDVSDKWRDRILMMPADALNDAAFRTRVQRSAEYFGDALCRIYPVLFNKLKTVRTENKKAAAHGAEIAEDLRRSASISIICLQKIHAEGFSTGNYLKTRQQAYLQVTADPTALAKQKAKAERAKKKDLKATKAKERKPKGETYEKTLTLYRQGLDLMQIAKERNLTPSTINGHFAKLITEGKLNVDDIISPVIRRKILDVLPPNGDTVNFDDLKNQLPGISGYAISLVIKLHNNTK